ncbi:Spc98 family-domain-containing protein [Fimicolochytrium jonesii]|uniref:Spc98 family-domain-containing protein n=1 Tax=Fimicolochytrium jonesii TaxID=1396493 RepID=UPI0022FEEF4C|nr:Spc98 family-domain-containing protein [Fimicolochytrium jonesii]KAI8822594.1 Spc98 family-domain-containing protein [Fimicolochytrium jonesii]
MSSAKPGKTDGDRGRQEATKQPLSASTASYKSSLEPLGSLSSIEQERLIINDLLYILMGIDGLYIPRRRKYLEKEKGDRERRETIEFTLDPTMDPSLAELVKRMLPIAVYLHKIDNYIETQTRFRSGRVQHALAATTRALLKNYFMLIAQLENQTLGTPDFGLQQLWFYIHPSLLSMSAIASLIDALLDAETKSIQAHRKSAKSAAAKVGASSAANSYIDESNLEGLSPGGGLILSVICDRLLSFSGDPVMKRLYGQLLSAAAVPYNIMLSKWIHSGFIIDPHAEFMVREILSFDSEQLRQAYSDVYWEARYELRADHVPTFFSTYQNRIFLAGKYLNVLRECKVNVSEVDDPEAMSRAIISGGSSTALSPMGDIVEVIGAERLINDIENAYAYANRDFLKLLWKDCSLLDRLRSVKHYFLLDKSDFFVHFLDVSHEHLLKPAKDVGIEQVKLLLELVLRDPAAGHGLNTFKEDVEVQLCPKLFIPRLAQISKGALEIPKSFGKRKARSGRPAVDYMNDLDLRFQASIYPGVDGTQTGLEALQLQYCVPFPTSLIITKRTLEKYQVLFRHLFHCKYVERQLADAWRDEAKTKLYNRSRRFRKQKSQMLLEDVGEEDADVEREAMFMARICALRTKMLHLMQQYLYHVCYEVIEPLWNRFEEQIQKVDTVEEVQSVQTEFQDRLFKECMLWDYEMLKGFRILLMICMDFSHFSHSYCHYKTLNPSGDTYTSSSMPAGMSHDSHPSAFPEQAHISDSYVSAVLNPAEADRVLSNFEVSFLHHMRRLIDTLKYNGVTETGLFSGLAARLDYNLFFARLPPDLSMVVQAGVGSAVGSAASLVGEGDDEKWAARDGRVPEALIR